jgi:hypothetical protein
MLTAIVATIAFTVQPSPPPEFESRRLGQLGKVVASWQDVEAYLDLHATYRNSVAESLMEEEASRGEHTWIRMTTVSGGGILSRIRPDGSGIGWPSMGYVVGFATASRMHAAADLIEAVAAGRRATFRPQNTWSIR